MQPVRRHLEVDGLRLSFLERGTAVAGEPSLVLLHGLMGCAETFRALVQELPEAQHVVALDLPGAGESERRGGHAADLASMASVTLRALEVLGIERPVLLGHSHGGTVAMQCAATEPGAVRSLVLLAPAHPYFREDRPIIRFYLSLPGRLFAYSLPWFPRWLQMVGLRRMAGPRNADTFARLKPYRDNLRTPGTMRHLLTLLGTWSEDMKALHRKLLTPLSQPTLIVWGDADIAVPVHSARKLRGAFLRSRLEVLRGVGHRPAEEAAAKVAGLVTQFVADAENYSWSFSPKVEASQARKAPLMTPSFESGD